MSEWAESIIYSPVGEGLAMIAVVAGTFGIFTLVLGFDRTVRLKVIAWSCVALMIAFIAFSMLFEELLPNWSTLSESRRLPYALSFAGFMLFLVMFILSARRLVVDGLLPNLAVLFIRGKAPPGVRTEALRALRPGLLMFGVAAAVFAVSLIGYHGAETTLGWAMRN